MEANVVVLSACGRQHNLYIHSTKNTAGLFCLISLLIGQTGDVLKSQCLLQYTILDKDCNEVHFDVPVPAHGSSKGNDKPYYPSKKSIIEAIKKNMLLLIHLQLHLAKRH